MLVWDFFFLECLKFFHVSLFLALWHMGSKPNTSTEYSAYVPAALLSCTVWQVLVTTHQSIRFRQSLLFHPIHIALNVRFISTLCAGSWPHLRACPLWPCLHSTRSEGSLCVCVCIFFFTLVVSWAVVHSVRIVKCYGLQPEVHQGVQPVVCRLHGAVDNNVWPKLIGSKHCLFVFFLLLLFFFQMWLQFSSVDCVYNNIVLPC